MSYTQNRSGLDWYALTRTLHIQPYIGLPGGEESVESVTLSPSATDAFTVEVVSVPGEGDVCVSNQLGLHCGL